MDPNDGACRLGELHGLDAVYFSAVSDRSPAFSMSCRPATDGGFPQYFPPAPHPARVVRIHSNGSLSIWGRCDGGVCGECYAVQVRPALRRTSQYRPENFADGAVASAFSACPSSTVTTRGVSSPTASMGTRAVWAPRRGGR
jgi:hypothetical protein